MLHERDDVKEELLSEFRLSADHETLENASSLSDELVDGVFREADCVAEVDRIDVVELTSSNQRFHYLNR